MLVRPTSAAGVAMAAAAGAVVAVEGVVGAGAVIHTERDVAVLEPVGARPSTLTCATREVKEPYINLQISMKSHT